MLTHAVYIQSHLIRKHDLLHHFAQPLRMA